ncbi:MAG: threonine/serine exporter family protein [Clostridiales bacterium]|nr:threonine/serine exporter family protein [Clostridiales bacterium]
MDIQRQKNIMVLALFAGEIMLKSGAEVYRVEDTVDRICRACGIPYVEVVATISSISLSLDSDDPERPPLTFIKRIRSITVDLEKVSRVNQFSREFTTTDLSVDEGRKILKEINGSKSAPAPALVAGAAAISAFFSAMLGGGLWDFVYAAISGAVAYSLSLVLERLHANSYMRIFLCCALATLLAVICANLDPRATADCIIIGGVMIFLPGVAITNAIRDALAGDPQAAVSRAVDAFLVAISIAVGAGMVIALWQFAGGVV